ncbi:MAG TPA: methyltransferase domain-containing protein [Vicinamibacterales bacterium]|jgi:SAM-dependent methyltransferase
MRETDLQYLVCPRCAANLTIDSVSTWNGIFIERARLECLTCRRAYPVVRGIPRFVSSDNYASSFGLEWTEHARTQYDSYTRLNLSEKRFFEETRWPRDLSGEVILEVGSGAGRFTEQAASTGAFVVSMDYSAAVDANYQSNGTKPNVLIVQGDVYQMPFRRSAFDKVFCFGMLQHTPDVRKTFLALPPMLKPGGELVVDVYKKKLPGMFLQTKYYVRPLTRRVPPDRLYQFSKKWVDVMWPLSRAIGRIPRIGHSINWRLLVADYSFAGVSGALLKEWAYLDTFDMLSPRYDSPQTLSTIRRWFAAASLEDVEVCNGYNGIEGRGKRPPIAARSKD